MSFMFNPHPYDDPTAINRPKLSQEVINSIVSGTKEAAGHLTNVIIKKLEKGNVVVALGASVSVQCNNDITFFNWMVCLLKT